MQQYYRIALWMCLLIGYLQAQPVTTGSINFDDLGLDNLNGLSCKPNVTFTSTAVKGPCYAATLKLREEWEHARENCDESFQLNQTLDFLNYVLGKLSQTQCDFTMTVHEQFGNFVKATKEFVQVIKSE